MGSTQLRQGGAGSSTNLGVAMQELSDPAQQFWSIFETKIDGRFQTKFTFIIWKTNLVAKQFVIQIFPLLQNIV